MTIQKTNTLSIEEYLEGYERFIAAPHEVEALALDASRAMDIAAALEEIAVVADSIPKATAAETRLIEIGGDISVAGTNTSAEAVIPSLEAYTGSRVAVEEFNLREKIAQIWKVIKETLKKIWAKIQEFISMSDMLLSHSIKKAKSLDIELKKAKRMLPSTSKIGLDTNERDIFNRIWTHQIGTAINDGKKIINDPKEIIRLIGASQTIISTFFRSYSDQVIKAGEMIANYVGQADTDNVPDLKNRLQTNLGKYTGQMFDSAKKAIYSIGSNKPSNVQSTDGLERITLNTNMLGAPAFSYTAPKVGDFKGDFASFVDLLKNSKISLQPRTYESLAQAPKLEAPYTIDEMIEMNDAVYNLLRQVEFFKKNTTMNRLDVVQDKINDSIEKMNDKLEGSKNKEDVEAIKPLMTLSLVYMNWCRYPLVDIIRYVFRTQNALNWLISENLKVYTVKEAKKP